MHGLYHLGTSFCFPWWDLIRLRGIQSLLKEDTRRWVVLLTFTWDNHPFRRGQETLPVMKSWMDMLTLITLTYPLFPDSTTIYLRTECAANSFEKASGSWWSLPPLNKSSGWVLSTVTESRMFVSLPRAHSHIRIDKDGSLLLPFFPPSLLAREATIKHGRDRQREHDVL